VRHLAEGEAATETAPTDLTTASQLRPSGRPFAFSGAVTKRLAACYHRFADRGVARGHQAFLGRRITFPMARLFGVGYERQCARRKIL
jgi:hypothetical protein